MVDKNTVHHTLDNGLHLIGEPHAANKSAAIGFFVRTGARDEEARESGISHFLEHMMFKGTAKRSALDITYDLGNLGAQANAFTSEDNTVYYASVVPDYFPDMQELLSDMLQPALAPDEFDMEKKVILEEIALYKDRPQFFFFEKALIDFFAGHPAGNSVLGTTDSVGALSRGDMQAYFSRRYAPSNMALVATGRFDWGRFVQDAEKYCSSWHDFGAQRKASPYQGNEISRCYRRKNLTQAHVLYMSAGCGAQDEERYALSLLSMMMGDSSGSRTYWQLIDSGLADSAGCDSDERDGTGCFMGYASTSPENMDRVAEILHEILRTPLEFAEGDLQRAKTKLCTKVALSGELPMGRLMALGLEWNYLKKIHSLSEVITRIKAVTRREIEAALERFPLRVWSEFKMLPE